MSEYHKSQLPNGLRIVSVPMPHLHSAEMICYVGAGSRDETPQTAGISHFLEHMLFRGTAECPSSFELERAFEAIGGTVNAATDAETTCFHSRLHPDHLAEGARLFASMLLRPLFSDSETERQVILEEALEDLNERGEDISVDVLVGRLLWPGHPLSLPTVGTRQSLQRITDQELRGYHALRYTPGNTVIAVAGPVEHQGVHGAIEAHFAGWSPAPPPPPRQPPPPPVAADTPETTWVQDSDSQISIEFAFRTPGRNAAQTLPLRILRWLLGWGGTSRLMVRLREELGLTYNVEASLAMLEDCGSFTIDLAVAPENLSRAVEESLQVLEGLRSTPVPTEELAAVVRTYLFDLDFARDNTEALATRYGWGELVGYQRTIAQDRLEVPAVTVEQLQQTARELFVPGNLKAAFVGPWSDDDRRRTEAILRRFCR